MNERPCLDVLVVEDESLIRWAVSTTLSGAGHHVREAGDAATALAQLDATPAPDVALIDYRLPGTRGLDLLKTLHARAPHMAIVMMTADRAPDLDHAGDFGVHQILHKPFEMRDVEPALLSACAHRSTPFAVAASQAAPG